MSLQTILIFAAMEFVYSITPGPAVLLVSSYGFRKGFGAALAAMLGVETGNTIYLLISAAGLGALLATSVVTFEIVKWAGAAYLVALGSWTIWKAGKESPEDEKPRALNHPYVQALLTQLGNPKTMLFFGALLPQFLDTHRPLWPQYLIMWAIVAVGETVIVGSYGWIAARGGKIVHPRFAAWRERASGAMLIFIGAIFAFARRSA
jgi:homoserine/homoserine lactone efflux protein